MKKLIYFDNAATSGHKPKVVIDATLGALKNYSANPGRSGYKASLDAAIAVYKVREKTSDFFGSDGAEQVCFTANCTHSINFVLNGVLERGDHIIVSSLEHNAVMRPLHNLLKLKGIDFDIASVDLFNSNNTVESFKKLIKPNTKMIFTTNASNVTGTVIPIKEIGEICRNKGILFGVDAAQSAGVLSINMKEMHIDYLCVAAHKGLFAPMGTGILIARKPINNITILGGTGSNSKEMLQPENFPERLESGTLSVPNIMGVGAGIDFLKSLGINKIYEKELSLTKYLYEHLSNLGCSLYAPFPEKNLYIPVLSFNVKNKNSLEIADYLGKQGIAVRGGFHCAPYAHIAIKTEEIGAVRVSPSIYNNKSHCDMLIYSIKKYK